MKKGKLITDVNDFKEGHKYSMGTMTIEFTGYVKKRPRFNFDGGSFSILLDHIAQDENDENKWIFYELIETE